MRYWHNCYYNCFYDDLRGRRMLVRLFRLRVGWTYTNPYTNGNRSTCYANTYSWRCGCILQASLGRRKLCAKRSGSQTAQVKCQLYRFRKNAKLHDGRRSFWLYFNHSRIREGSLDVPSLGGPWLCSGNARCQIQGEHLGSHRDSRNR